MVAAAWHLEAEPGQEEARDKLRPLQQPAAALLRCLMAAAGDVPVHRHKRTLQGERWAGVMQDSPEVRPRAKWDCYDFKLMRSMLNCSGTEWVKHMNKHMCMLGRDAELSLFCPLPS